MTNAITAPANPPLLEVKGLQKYFPIKRGLLGKTVGHVKAVDQVSFTLGEGETLGLVGESGSGKTTVGRSILRLIEPTGGSVKFMGKELTTMGREELRKMRRHMQIIFQDPYSSLNPRMTVLSIVGEPLKIHDIAKGSEIEDRVASLLKRVGLNPDYMKRYPHEFSGGQRQRIGIARALALSPKLIVCDEPVSALDVSVQAQVVNLLQDLQDELKLSYLFIAHDLSVVEHISHRVAVMYIGRIMEIAPSRELYAKPTHPYTQALLSAIPEMDPTIKKQRQILQGDPPTPINPPSGCVFRTRCPIATVECAQAVPPLEAKDAALPLHLTACIHA